MPRLAVREMILEVFLSTASGGAGEKRRGQPLRVDKLSPGAALISDYRRKLELAISDLFFGDIDRAHVFVHMPSCENVKPFS